MRDRDKDGDGPESAPARLRVLLVDDQPSVLAAYRRLLGTRFEVEVALGGREALDLLDRDSAFDAVICDVMMPEVDGPAVYRHLTVRHPELARRTAFCTAGAYTPSTVAFTEAMRDRLLLKPVDAAQLASVVEGLARR